MVEEAEARIREVHPDNDVRPMVLCYGNRDWFICGPDPMMDAAEAALVQLGVPAERIHTERFDMA